MKDVIETNKYVELTYEVIDQKSGQKLTSVEFPLGYVHGVNMVLSPQVSAELEGRSAGEIIEVPLDCNKIFGPRDESLVITEHIRNVPEGVKPRVSWSPVRIEKPSPLMEITRCVAERSFSSWKSCSCAMQAKRRLP
jgi:FKBP-type peptidyl-prolyl cis-trans isomerase 2